MRQSSNCTHCTSSTSKHNTNTILWVPEHNLHGKKCPRIHMPTKCRISYSCAASTSHNSPALPYITTRSTDHPCHTNAPEQLNAGAQPGALQQRACSLYAWPIIPSPKQAHDIFSRDTQHRKQPHNTKHNTTAWHRMHIRHYLHIVNDHKSQVGNSHHISASRVASCPVYQQQHPFKSSTHMHHLKSLIATLTVLACMGNSIPLARAFIE